MHMVEFPPLQLLGRYPSRQDHPATPPDRITILHPASNYDAGDDHARPKEVSDA